MRYSTYRLPGGGADVRTYRKCIGNPAHAAAANELNLFHPPGRHSRTTVEELAETLAIHPRPAEMLLTGCAALGLLEKQGGRYRKSPLAGSWRNYTAGEYGAWLETTGFGDIRTVRFDAAGANGAVIARKPERS